MNTHRPARTDRPDPAPSGYRPGDAATPHGGDPLTVLAQSMESLRPDGAPPAWAEIIGPLTRPEQARWHGDLDTLMGFVAPADCAAIVTVGYGWAHDAVALPPSRRDGPRRRPHHRGAGRARP